MEYNRKRNKQPLLKPIVGFDGYKVDVNNWVVYGALGEMKVHNRNVFISRNGIHFCSKIPRLVYAAQHGIDPTLIPTDVYVVEKDGKAVLIKPTDFYSQHAKEQAEKNDGVFFRAVRDIGLIADFYDGKTTPLIEWVQEKARGVVNYLLNHNYGRIMDIQDAVLEAEERFWENVERHRATMVFPFLLKTAKGIMQNRRKDLYKLKREAFYQHLVEKKEHK